ncbi:branched-chain amino acid transport system substrate-binding protein [Beijerinckia sp. GAS462]|nr:branched-chain amino acid transport system substrate-binding protein [Beijerinckia sp. GAS462]SEB61041.1 amino acid/amide ABC transporter substrate-binding protein, HAAT family [Beijerinckia sp. 28-YEA-48]
MKQMIAPVLAAASLIAAGATAQAQDVVKVGLIAPMTGPQAAAGRQMVAGAKLYMALHGDTVAGKKIELLVRDDTGVADVTRRLAQELIVNDKAAVISGFGLTPLAIAVGPLITQAKVPAVIMVAGTASIVAASPYFVRVSFTLPQQTAPGAEWAAANGIKTVVSMVSDYGPGLDAQNAFKAKFEEKGGKVLEQLRAPLVNPDFAPFLQRARDLKPDALMLFVPAPVAGSVMRQVLDRGLPEAGIKVIGPGDAFDDEQLNAMGDGVLGSVTSYNYSAAHDSAENKKFVTEYRKANNDARPNVIAVGGYDGLHAVYAALTKTSGDSAGPKLIEAFKGLSWESPRGPLTIDAQTREPVQNIYIRRVERKDGELYHAEFATYPNQKP